MENSLITLDADSQRQYALMQTPTEQKMFVLMRSPKAVTYMANDYIDLIGELYLFKKQPVTDDEIQAEALMLKAEVQKYFSFISFDELREALNAGIRATDENAMFGINIAEMNKAIQRHMIASQPNRRAVLERLNQPQAEKSEAEKEQILMDALTLLKEKVSAGESLIENSGAFGVYRWLKRTERIKGSMFTPEDIERIKKQAENHIRGKATVLQNKLDPESRKQAKSIIDNLETGLLENEMTALCQKLSVEFLIKQGKI